MPPAPSGARIWYRAQLTADETGAGFHRGPFEESCRREPIAEQRLDFLPQRLISIARLPQESVALAGRAFHRGVKELRNPMASIRLHGVNLTGTRRWIMANVVV